MLQAKAQLPLSHSATPFVGAAHAVQLEPQRVGSLSAKQPVPQRCEPALQESPHAVPSQVVVPVPAVGPGQAVHDRPQLAVELLERQAVPHRWLLVGQELTQPLLVHEAEPPVGELQSELLQQALVGMHAPLQVL
jgi:hypothetical protein